jgi:ribonuclease HI
VRTQDSHRPSGSFNFRKANWDLFGELISEALQLPMAQMSIEAENAFLTRAILEAAKRSIPFGSRKVAAPWWSPECAEAKRALNVATRAAKESPSPEATTNLATARTAFDRAVQSGKLRAWQEFVASLSPSTPSTAAWALLRKLEGSSKESLPDTPITTHGPAGPVSRVSDQAKANAAVKHYAAISRVSIRKADIQSAYQTVRAQIASKSGHGDPLSAPFSRAELDAVLNVPRGSAAGPDRVAPAMLDNLPPIGRFALLRLINRTWMESYIPTAWKTATIIPIRKRGKPADAVGSYRPVSLLSCIGKCAESLVKTRLDHWAATHHLVAPSQAGFQAGRSTTDCVAQLAQHAFDGLNRPKPASRSLVVAVDFKAAFDRVWRGGLLADLARADIPSRWLSWLRAFLTDRRARVRWNSSTSDPMTFQQGVPQGSPLSPLLYVLSTSSLLKELASKHPATLAVAYADDLTLVSQQNKRHGSSAPQEMQAALNAVERWASDHYVSIAPEKTEALFVSVDPLETCGKWTPNITLGGQPIRFSAHPKILGVVLDSQLRFGHHATKAAQRLRGRCHLLRALAGTSWGTDAASLRRLYVGFARPAGLYAAGAWWPFLADSHKSKLDRINSSAARSIAGLPAGTATAAALIEADIPPLNVIANRDTATSFLAAHRRPISHPLGLIAHQPASAKRLKNSTGPRGDWRSAGLSHLEALPDNCGSRPWTGVQDRVPPWEWRNRDNLQFHLAGAERKREDPPELRRRSAERDLAILRATAAPSLEVWTDGSASAGTDHGRAGVHFALGNLPDVSRYIGRLCSSTTAESAGVAIALEMILAADPAPGQCIWVLSDSRAMHSAISHASPSSRERDSWLEAALSAALRLAASHSIHFVWVPGHAGLPGNEMADHLASTSDPPLESRLVEPSAVKSLWNRNMKRHWLDSYLEATDPEGIHRRASNGGNALNTQGLSRAESSVLHQLRCNRAPFLQATLFRWRRAASAACECGAPSEDTEHFLCHCPRWAIARSLHLCSNPPLSVLQHSPRRVLDFIREIACCPDIV